MCCMYLDISEIKKNEDGLFYKNLEINQNLM